ncbi:MAG: hypothetical protein ACP5PW_01480, partial [Candidatus Dormibacteria bacterium]
MATQQFSYTGASTTYTVPDACTELIVSVVGAAGGAGGGSSDGGAGGSGQGISASLSVSPGDV